MAFVDPFLLTVTLVMTILLIVANLYFVAKYAHPADSAFGSSTACKAVIVNKIPISIFALIDCCLYVRRMLNTSSSTWCWKLQRRFKCWYEDILVYYLYDICVLHDYHFTLRSLLLWVWWRLNFCKTFSFKIWIENQTLDCS